jgi:hypothetical protein
VKTSAAVLLGCSAVGSAGEFSSEVQAGRAARVRATRVTWSRLFGERFIGILNHRQ